MPQTHTHASPPIITQPSPSQTTVDGTTLQKFLKPLSSTVVSRSTALTTPPWLGSSSSSACLL